MRQKGVQRMRQLERPGGGKVYRMSGNGFFSNLGRLGKSLLTKLAPIAKSVAKDLAPMAITAASNKAASELSKRGVSDNLVNSVGRLGQTAAQSVGKKLDSGKLNENQKLVADFISNKGQSLLGDFIEKRGMGVRGLGVRGLGAGEGVRGLGVRGLGVRPLGGGNLTIQDAPRI